MSATPSKFTKFGHRLLFGICCVTLVGGCDTSQTDSNNTPAQTSDRAEPAAGPGLQSGVPEAIKQAGAQAAAAQPDSSSNPVTAKTKALDLTRDHLDDLDQTMATDTEDPSNLLPDLFDDNSPKTGARASGRVLMKDNEQGVMEAIEGVEFTLEVPVN